MSFQMKEVIKDCSGVRYKLCEQKGTFRTECTPWSVNKWISSLMRIMCQNIGKDQLYIK